MIEDSAYEGHPLVWSLFPLWLTGAYGRGEPELGMEAAKWNTDQKISLVGSDNWAIEAVPHEDPERPYPVHQWNLVQNGVYHLENLDLDELTRSGVKEFAFVFCPLRLKGATGSPGNPIAIR